MSEITRREALGRLALAFTVAGTFEQLDAQQTHAAVHEATGAGGTYSPRALTADQFRALERLADLIIPVDVGKPGAIQAQVPAWIDSLLEVNAELKERYVTGLDWLDTTMRAKHAADFASATLEQQTALLDQIAYQKNRSPELTPGIDFFVLARRMTVDGFYTSPIGMRDIYPGNTPRTAFTVPQAAYDHVLNRSPFK
jgi:hypothetical protein